MMGKTALAVICLLLHVCCEGFEFTYDEPTRAAATTAHSDQACGVLQCTDIPSGSRKLAGLTIYRRDRSNTQDDVGWEQVTAVTQRSPKVDVLSEAGRISAEISDTKGEVRVELFKAEDCRSSGSQYSCVAVLVDDRGHTTLTKSVLGGKIGSDSGPNLDCAEQRNPQAPNEFLPTTATSATLEKLGHLVTSMLEKQKCIETRLEESQKTGSKLEEKIDSMRAVVIDKIHNLETGISDKLMASEMRTEDKIVKVKERLEDKLMMVRSRTRSGASQDVCLKTTILLGEISESVQSIKNNLTDFREDIHDVEASVLELTSNSTAMDRKLEGVVSSVDDTSALTSQLVRDVASLSRTCERKTPDEVDEYFDALETGAKEWRLAFRGTAYNNVEVYPAFIHGTGIPVEVEAGCKQLNHSVPCVNHYRNREALENWANVHRVLFAIYAKGQMVKRILFNGRGSTFTSWFSGDRVLSSSWGDLAHKSHNIFSIEGDTRTNLLRRFLVNHLYNGCPGDQGWFLAGDAVPGGCTFERKLARPMFLYSKGDYVALLSSPQQVARADAIGVFIKYQ